MSPWSRRLAAPLALCLLLASGAAAGVQQDKLVELKLMQQRILMSEPAERVEQRERFDAWRKKVKRAQARGAKVGARIKPLVPRTDMSGHAVLLGKAAASPARFSSVMTATNVAVNDTTGEPDGACQSEVSLAMQGNRVVATWNDGIGIYQLPQFGPDTQGFGYSTDGGLTWTDGGAIPNDGTFTWSSDPVVVVDDKTGDFYYSALIDAGSSNGIAVIKGRFCGNAFSWDAPMVVATFPTSSTLLDKEWLAADSLTGNLYLSFSNFLMVGNQAVSNSIQFTRSSDQGQTWSTPQTLSALGDAGLVQGSRPAVGPNGEVYVVWYTIGQPSGPNANSPFGRDFLRVRKSVDKGVTFAASVTADSLFSNFSSGAPGFNRGIGITFPGIAVDRSTGPRRGDVYVAWNEALNFYNDPFPNPGQDPARTEIEPNNGSPQATRFVPGDILRGNVATPLPSNDLDYWKWGATQGQTAIFYIDSLASTLDASFRVFCSDGNTLLGFSQNGTGGSALLVFTAPATDTFFLRVASYGGAKIGKYRILTTLNTPQNDRARDQRDIFVKSSSNGTNWGPTVRVNDSPNHFDDWLPEVQVDGTGRVFVADYDWRDSAALCGGGSNAYLYRSDDGGTTWTPGERVSDVTTNWTTTYSTLLPNQGDYIGLIASESTVHVAWGDGRFGDPDIFLATPTAGAACTQTPVCLVDTSATRTQISAVWSAPNGFSAEILRSTDGGPFVDLGQVTASSNQITYQDNTVTCGHVYTYGLNAPGFCQPVAGAVTATPVTDQSPVTSAAAAVDSTTITVTWGAPQGVQATVSRSAGTGPFVDLGTVTANASDQIVYVDLGLAPGETYTYRLALTGYCLPFVGQVSATIPGGGFGITGIRPNPSKGKDVLVTFAIDPTAPATVELIDISGRQVKRINVTCASSTCEVNLTQGDRPKSGLYFVRLEQQGRESVKRVSIFP
jgi:hypothetical protein